MGFSLIAWIQIILSSSKTYFRSFRTHIKIAADQLRSSSIKLGQKQAAKLTQLRFIREMFTTAMTFKPAESFIFRSIPDKHVSNDYLDDQSIQKPLQIEI